MNKIISSIAVLIFASTAFALPAQPPNGGSGVANCASCTMTVNAPVVLSSSASSELDIISTTKGSRPVPSMTTAQINAIAMPAIGLQAYDNQQGVLKYYDGLMWQTDLTIDKLIAGSNVTVQQNGDGTVTISATAGGSGNASDFAGYGIVNNNVALTSIPAPSTFYPVAASASRISDNISSNFVNEIYSVVFGYGTQVFRYTGAPTQYFEANIDFSFHPQVAAVSNYVFQLAIRRANGTIVHTGYYALQDTTSMDATGKNASITGIIQLSTGDRVYLEVEDTVGTNALFVSYGSGTIHAVNLAVQDIQGGTWSPVCAPNAGILAGVTPYNSFYTQVNNMVIATTSMTYTATDATITMTCSLPITSNFSTNAQANLMGQTFFDVSSLSSADGKVRSVISSPFGGVQVNAISALGSGGKEMTVSWIYEVIP